MAFHVKPSLSLGVVQQTHRSFLPAAGEGWHLSPRQGPHLQLSGEGRAEAQPAHRAPRGEEAEKVPGTLSGHKYAFRVFRQLKSHMRTGGGSAQVKDSETPVPS